MFLREQVNAASCYENRVSRRSEKGALIINLPRRGFTALLNIDTGFQTCVTSSQDDYGAVQRRQGGLASAHARLRRFGDLQQVWSSFDSIHNIRFEESYSVESKSRKCIDNS